MKKLLVLANLLLIGDLANAENSFLNEIKGVYKTPARFCSSVGQDGTTEPCVSPPLDCLSIEPINDTQAHVQVYSVQTNGHDCEIDGVANLKGHSLIYTFSPTGYADEKDAGQKASIDFSNKKVTIRYLNLRNDRTRMPFCAIRARIDLVKFDKKDKVTTNGNCN